MKRFRWMSLVVVGAMIASCSSDDPGSKKAVPGAPNNPFASYAIHVFGKQKPGVDVELAFSPVETVSNPTATGEAVSTPGSKPAALVESDGGMHDTDDVDNLEPGWLLLMRAAHDCAATESLRGFVNGITPPWAPATGHDGWYVFAGELDDPGAFGRFNSCEKVLALEHILLCTADKLQEVAETVSPLVWPVVNSHSYVLPTGTPPAYMGWEWTIPPQSSKDKFIVRDLALNVLANLARLDMEPPHSTSASAPNKPLPVGDTCADAWAKSAAAGSYFTDSSTTIYSTAPIDPEVTITSGNREELAELRFRQNTQILRTAARMTKTLIEDSAMADLAGAERQRGKATDSARGPALFWGAETDSTAPYNSLTHAFRVLFGRWETNRITGASAWDPPPSSSTEAPVPSGDPKCGEWAPMELLGKSSDAISARWQDRPSRKPAHEFATSVLGASGIVMPKSSLETNLAGVKTAVTNQLLFRAANQAGTTVTATAFTERKLAIEQMVNEMDNADFRFAMDRNLVAYRLLTGAEEDTVVPATDPAGVKLVGSGDLDASITTQGGTVLESGIPRLDVIGDVFARLAPGFTASQCRETPLAGVLEGSANSSKTAAFQDSFMIGETFRRRLSQVRELASATGYPTSSDLGDTLVPKMADRASAEVRTWTGPGLVMYRWGERVLQMRIQGLTPADLGVTTAAAMKTRIRAVWGKPWVADCATGQRKSCPASFEDNYVRTPSVELVDSEVSDVATYTGADGRVFVLEFNLGTGPAGFTPSSTPLGTAPANLLYLVAAGDPKNPTYGKTLAALPFRGVSDDWSFALISDYQRKLANDLFSVARNWSTKAGNLGEEPSTTPPGYCIKGVPRDFFVPLENELTSDSDSFESSWKHYLLAAKEAAGRADELGQKLIDIGLQTDMKKEAAQEDLGKLCGDFSAAQHVEVVKGQVQATSDDSSLNACLEEETYDVTFLTSLPPIGVMDDAEIRTKYLGCGASDTRPVCGNGITPTPALDKAGLGITGWYDPENEDPPVEEASCELSLGLVDSLATSFNGGAVQAAIDAEDLSASNMGAVLKAMRVEMDGDLQWKVYLDSALLMSTMSADNGYWPVCNTNCNWTTPGGTAGQIQAEKFRKIFGAFDTAGSTAHAARNAAFERLSGTLWLLGAMSGQVPEGLFRLPIPARNNMGSTDAEPAAVLYTKGQFTTTTPYYIDLTPETPSQGPLFNDDKKIIGSGTPITADFANAMAAGSSSRPQWVKDVYSRASSNPTDYLHITASNSGESFAEQPSLTSWIIQQGQRLSGAVDGGSCTGVSTTETNAARTAFVKMKYPNKVSSLCRTPDGKSGFVYYKAKELGSGAIQDVYQFLPGDHPRSLKDIVPMRKDGNSRGELKNNETWYAAGNACKHEIQTIDGYSMPFVLGSCLNDTGTLSSPGDHIRFTRSALSGVGCPPAGRAKVFIDWDSQIPNGCKMARELAAALALTCATGNAYRALGVGEPLPALNTVDDINKLETWIDDQSNRVRILLSRLHLVNVPKRVVVEQQNNQVGNSAYKGQHGQLVLQYRDHLTIFANKWLGMQQELDSVRNAIDAARNSLVLAKIHEKEALVNLAMQEIQLHATMLKAGLAVAAGALKAANPTNGATAAGGSLEAASAGVDFKAARDQLGKLQELKQLAGDKQAATVKDIMIKLQGDTSQAYSNLEMGVQAMQGAVSQAHQTAAQLEQNQSEAQYEAAQAAGADYYIDSMGNIVTLPVNTVQRRLYDLTKRRYEAALKDAQYLSYMARLAIEQRIGMRLKEMEEPIGSLEAPSEWADDVCSFQGVNYESLRKAVTPDSGIFSVVNELYYLKYADPFIGDYVAKLEHFVEFYNIEYPSHEGDDVAVLSVRDDLLGPGGKCYRPSRNLLFYSHALSRAQPTDETETTIQGWQNASCEVDDPYCLIVVPGQGLTVGGNPLPTPGYAPSEGYTWLHEGTLEQVTGSATPASTPKPPSRSVYQAVELTTTSYALSWHDMVRDDDDPDVTPTSANEDYFVGVYDANWDLVASFTGKPHVYSGAQPWSLPQVIPFTVKMAGTHYIAFSASAKGAATPGSVAIANVQLEEAANANSITGYEATDASRLVLTGDCTAGNPEMFRAAFEYHCNGNTCFYDLRKPFAVDLRNLIAGTSPLAGKVAQDNFNYRTLTVALNVVGTGVIDCSKTPTPSCFGSPYVEYTFEHDALDSLIIDYLGFPRAFNFGLAGIRYGKALAAERFVTLPMGSTDQAFFSQPEFQKVEFRGRPLDGTYRLRVFDSPSLDWTKVEDIQVILNYRYWSRVARESQQN